MSAGGRLVGVNGISLQVTEHGTGVPVLLVHGWPDSGELWRHQVPALVAAGFRVIVPDMRGFGRSERPAEVSAYALPTCSPRSPCGRGALLRALGHGHGDLERAIANLSRPGALTASLNWYRANVAPRMPCPPVG